MLIEWLDRAAHEIDPDSLSDEAVLALADAQMDEEQQDELSELLYLNQDGALSSTDRARLEELMQVYRRGLLRKAKALHVAVRRGLRPPLTDSE